MNMLVLPAVKATAGVVSVPASRRVSSLTVSKFGKPFSRISRKYRSKAIEEAQSAVIDYLHTTRYMPFIHAENIVKNSHLSLWKIVSQVPFLPSTFSKSLQRFLRYHPINELEFFLESIGVNGAELGDPRPGLLANTVFLSDWKQFDVACALSGLGFPWVKLGLLYKEDYTVFEMDPCGLGRSFNEIKEVYGFSSVDLIGVCIVWPRVLYCDMNDLLINLKTVFLDFDFSSSLDGNVDALLDVCRKIRLFYDLGCEMETAGEVLGRSKSVLLEYSEEDLRRKIEYFCKLAVRKDEIGLFLLARPEIFCFDIEERVISVSGFLKHFGMREEKLKSLEQQYPHVFGRNRIANLPNVMRAMDLSKWFFDKLQNENHYLFSTYTISRMDEDLDKYYLDYLQKIQASRTHVYTIEKLNFLHSIGFGENRFTANALARANSSGTQLQNRFDYLLQCGIEYSKLCAMVKSSPKILNQQEKVLQKKLDYLCRDMGSSLEYLGMFPSYLCYDLERRIKPRYMLHKCLVEEGFCKREYSIATIVASGEKSFNARIYRINPTAAKKFLESSDKYDSAICKENCLSKTNLLPNH